MSLYSASRGVSIVKRYMDHLADSIAKLSQGRKNWYIGMEGVPVDDSPGEKCEPALKGTHLQNLLCCILSICFFSFWET